MCEAFASTGSRRSPGWDTWKKKRWRPGVSCLLFETALPVQSQRQRPTANFRCWGNVEPAAGHPGPPQESRIWILLWHASTTQRASEPQSVEAATYASCCLLCSGCEVVDYLAAAVHWSYRGQAAGRHISDMSPSLVKVVLFVRLGFCNFTEVEHFSSPCCSLMWPHVMRCTVCVIKVPSEHVRALFPPISPLAE